MRTEWRVRWKREKQDGYRYKRVRDQTGAEKFKAFLLGDWEGAGIKADAYWCCAGGRECDCGGLTMREHYDKETVLRTQYVGPVVDIQIASREVGGWQASGKEGLS